MNIIHINISTYFSKNTYRCIHINMHMPHNTTPTDLVCNVAKSSNKYNMICRRLQLEQYGEDHRDVEESRKRTKRGKKNSYAALVEDSPGTQVRARPMRGRQTRSHVQVSMIDVWLLRGVAGRSLPTTPYVSQRNDHHPRCGGEKKQKRDPATVSAVRSTLPRSCCDASCVL